MDGMAVLRGWLPHRGNAQMACNYCFPTMTMFYVQNKFRILKERHVQMRKYYQSPYLVRMNNSSYDIAPVGDRTHDLPHTGASNPDEHNRNEDVEMDTRKNKKRPHQKIYHPGKGAHKTNKHFPDEETAVMVRSCAAERL